MANEVTIDELRIEIEAESGAAASNLDKLAQSLDRLQAVTQRVTSGSDGLNKVAKQIEKLNTISQKIQSMQGFEKLERAVDSLKKLNDLNNIGDISGFVRNLGKLPQAMNAIAQMQSIDASKFQQIADALKPLQSADTSGLNTMLNALRKLPKVSQELAGVDFARFTQQISQIAQAIEPLARQAQSAGAGLTALAQVMQQTNRQARQSSEGVSLFNTAIGNIKVKTLAAIAGLQRLFSLFRSSVTTSNEYVENLNLFTVTMGEAADEALKFANTVNELMGIDVSQWIQNQGVFKQMTSGFGMMEEKANLLSKNLTQLGFDISSYYNISVESAMQKLQSALAGEQEPLRRLGYALDETTIKQVALNHGITQSVTDMSQAQKAQLRYIAIMEQSTNAMGDMARTIDSPANQLRVLESRILTLKRAIGDSLMPVVSAVLPYLTALIQILGETFRSIAEFMGFELPVFDYSDLKKGGQDVASSFDKATKASKEFKGTLAGIDQLNIIGSKKEDSGAGNLFGTDLDLMLPEYDFLGNLEAETSKAYDTLKKFLDDIAPVAAGIATALGALFIGDKVTAAFKAISEGFKFLTQTPLGKFVSTITAAVTAFLGFKKIVKDLTTGNGSLYKLSMAIGGVVTAVTVFLATKNPLGAVLTVIGAGLGSIIGYVDGIKQKAEENAMAKITAAFERGVTPISDVADALERVSKELTSSESDYLKRKESLQSISDNAYNVGTNIRTMISELEGMETVSPEVISNLEKAFEDLATASKQYIEESNNNFKLYILANQEMLQAQGFNVSSMVDIINQGTKNATDSIAELEARAKELGEKRLNIGLDTGELAELDEINMKLLQMSGVEIDFGVDTKAVEDVLNNLSSIKFEDAESAAKNMEIAFSAVSDAYSTLETARKKMLGDIDRMALFGELDDSQTETLRNAINSLFDAKTLKLDETFSKPINSILQQAESLGVHIEADIARGTTEAIENAGLFAIFNGDFRKGLGGKDYADINKEKYKDIVGEAAPYLENPLNQLYISFAEKGLSKDIVDRMRDNGKNITQGVADGISNNTSMAIGAIKGVAADTENAWREATRTHSPSELYTEFGGYLMEGLSDGILSRKSDVLAAIHNVAKSMYERMSSLKVKMPILSLENVNGDIDMDEVYERVKKTNSSLVGSYSLPSGIGSVAGAAMGAAREAYSNAAQNAAATTDGSAMDININLQSFVELDGEQVGQAVSQYQQRQMAYSNGK